MSPAPAAAQAPTSVSLFDLSVDAPLLRGLGLVRHHPGGTLTRAPRTSSPGIREDLGGTHEKHDRALQPIAPPENTFLLVSPSLHLFPQRDKMYLKFTQSLGCF